MTDYKTCNCGLRKVEIEQRRLTDRDSHIANTTVFVSVIGSMAYLFGQIVKRV
jgi:hypothetical protein